MEKKKYLKPLVETEDALEQTSLACNAVEVPSEGLVPKGGNFHQLAGCEIVVVEKTIDCPPIVWS